MTKAVLEAESEGEAQRTTAAVPSPALAVPRCARRGLTGSVQLRRWRRSGQQFGREFAHAVLASVVSRSEIELGSALDRLTARFAVARRAAARELSVQARPRSGCRLRYPFARAEDVPLRSHRRNSRKEFPLNIAENQLLHHRHSLRFPCNSSQLYGLPQHVRHEGSGKKGCENCTCQ